MDKPPRRPRWVTGWVEAAGRTIPRISTRLDRRDLFGAIRVRADIGRMRYKVDPGLYAVGSPGSGSPVFVTTNYKLTFDSLRRHLEGIDAWLLVIDTGGVNVWCSAGKGTLSAAALERAVREFRLEEVIHHRKLILPQLAAPGVAAHDVKKRTGFRVVYGPIRARDIPSFLEAGLRADEEMRRVRFPLPERAKLTPVELSVSLKYIIGILFVTALFSMIGTSGISDELFLRRFLTASYAILSGYLAGCVVGPILLPWLPGRAFALKGMILGCAVAGVFLAAVEVSRGHAGGWMTPIGLALDTIAITSFLLMNFTGATTFTSLSGVKREMQIFLPIQAVLALTGSVLWFAGRLS